MSLSTLQYTFDDIFNEYYTLYRGQGTSIPSYASSNNREYITGIHLGNNAIKKWERADGILWRELTVKATDQNTTVWPTNQRTLATGDVSYDAPTNMVKPPAFIQVGTANARIPVVDPHEVPDMGPNSTYVYFSGGAGGLFTMKMPSNVATQYDGQTIDYTYYKKATLLLTASNPGSTVPECSDPNFIIHWMLYKRLQQARNPYAQEVKAEAERLLADMKVNQNSGSFGNPPVIRTSVSGWGRSTGTKIL